MIENKIQYKPLDLSLSSLEEKVTQEFNTQIPIQEISKRLELSISRIYEIISKKKDSVIIKKGSRYACSIRYRIQEAQKLKITQKKIAEILHLKQSQVAYNCRTFTLKDYKSTDCASKSPTRKNLHADVMNKLRCLLYKRASEKKEKPIRSYSRAKSPFSITVREIVSEKKHEKKYPY